MRRTLPITFVILSVLLEPQAAHAYLDPGTGSMLLSVFVGLISGVYFVIRKLPSTLRSLFFMTDILLLSYHDNTRGGKLGYRGGSNPVTGNDSGLQGRFAKNGLPFCGKSHII